MLNDVFNSDLFSFTSLTSAVNNIPYTPQGLAALLPWNEQGVATVSVVVEEKDGVLTLVPTAPRGAPATQATKGSRKARSFLVPHYPFESSILAAEVQGVRVFGSDNALETVEQKRGEKLAEMSTSQAATMEYARAGAITGKLLDADGSTLYDWHSEFGVAQNTKVVALGTATTKVVTKLIEAKEQSEDELGSAIANGYVLVCGRTIFHEFVGHPTIEKAYERWQDGAALRADNRGGFKIADDITLVSYGRGKVGSTKFVADDEAYLCPVVPGLYQTRFAPADNIEAANTIGLPMYASAEVMKHGKGVELLVESNHLSYCEKPRSIIKITKS